MSNRQSKVPYSFQKIDLREYPKDDIFFNPELIVVNKGDTIITRKGVLCTVTDVTDCNYCQGKFEKDLCYDVDCFNFYVENHCFEPLQIVKI